MWGGVSKTYLIHDTLYVLLLFFLAQSNYFYYLCRTKNNNNLNISTLQTLTLWLLSIYKGGGLPTSASSVNAMCGASRHSCNPFRNDCLPFFLRHRQARRRNQGLQQSRRQSATLASCKAVIRRNAIETSHSCVLTDIMWRSALWWRQRNWRKGMKTLPFPARGLSIVIKVSDAFTLADFEVYGLTNKREQANFAISRRF